MAKPVILDVFGRRLIVERIEGCWRAYLVGNDGKRSPVNVPVPDDMGEDELAQYFDDVFHEAATPQRPRVVRLS
jgi:hypothetical protein